MPRKTTKTNDPVATIGIDIGKNTFHLLSEPATQSHKYSVVSGETHRWTWQAANKICTVDIPSTKVAER